MSRNYEAAPGATQGVSKPVVIGVARYDRTRGAQASPKERELMVSRYAAARAELAEYRAAVKRELDGPGLPVTVRVLALRLSLRLYRAFRKAYGDDVFGLVVEPVTDAVRRGMKPELALAVVRASRLAFGRAFSVEELARIRGQVEDNLKAGKGKRMPEVKLKKAEGKTARNAKAAKSEVRMQSAEVRAQNADSGNGRRPASSVKRNASSVKRHAPGPGISFDNVMQATPLERMRKQKAEVSLREALAVHQPVVKECVALRLCKHLGYDELAGQLDLTRRDVAEILEKLRPWVGRFTTFFESDWYWLEAVGPDTAV